MPVGRKEIEEFEQYLLFIHRARQLSVTFPGCDLALRILPDGQAGCWAFRLHAAKWLPLTASGYEIEYDLLVSTLDSGLRAAFTPPLIMSSGPRHSSASTAPVDMSLHKLRFIEAKLRITPQETAKAWKEFSQYFAGSAVLQNIPAAYGEALLRRADAAK